MDGTLTCRAPSTPESSAHTGGSGSANMCALLHSHQGHCATMGVAAGHSHGVGKHAPWIRAMLMNSYFGSCHTHAHQKKNECTYFCITCGYDNPHSLCQHCIVDHTGHSMIQIRRYVYCDVIRAMDISPHIDITGVQNYIINQAKVLFLNHRPQAKKGSPASADVCRTCCRTLREGYLYCSLACKVDSLSSSNETAAPHGVRALATPGGGSSDDSCEEEEALMEEDEMPVQPTARATTYRAPREACVVAPPSKRQCVQPRLFRQSSDSSTEEVFPAHLTLAPSFSMESLLAACGCSNNQSSGGGSSLHERSKLPRNNSRRKQFSPRQAPCV